MNRRDYFAGRFITELGIVVPGVIGALCLCAGAYFAIRGEGSALLDTAGTLIATSAALVAIKIQTQQPEDAGPEDDTLGEPEPSKFDLTIHHIFYRLSELAIEIEQIRKISKFTIPDRNFNRELTHLIAIIERQSNEINSLHERIQLIEKHIYGIKDKSSDLPQIEPSNLTELKNMDIPELIKEEVNQEGETLG